MDSVNIVDKLPKHNTKTYAKRDVTELKYIVIHHSAVDGQTAYNYARYHVNSRDWPGIGYTYVIEASGLVEKVNNITTISYHVGDYNRQSIGICVSGNLNAHPPTQEQYNSLAELIRVLLQEYPWLEIKGHWDFKQTECPGKNFDFAYLHTLLRNRPTYEDLEKENAELKKRLRQINKLSEV